MADNNTDGTGQMPVSAAGRKGGEETKRRKGSKFYSEIGKKGGEARRGDTNTGE